MKRRSNVDLPLVFLRFDDPDTLHPGTSLHRDKLLSLSTRMYPFGRNPPEYLPDFRSQFRKFLSLIDDFQVNRNLFFPHLPVDVGDQVIGYGYVDGGIPRPDPFKTNNIGCPDTDERNLKIG